MNNNELSKHVETDIKIIGDKTTNTQIVMLLAYIRYFLQRKQSSEIKVNIGKHVNSDFFAIQVNDQEIPELIPKDSVDIN